MQRSLRVFEVHGTELGSFAARAQTLYEESQESIERRAQLREQHRLAAASTPRPQSKPDKKSRRQLRDLKW